MQEHMKKLHTEVVNMTFTGPVAMMGQALDAMFALGFAETARVTVNDLTEGAIPWRKTSFYKELVKNSPAAFLSGARYREGLSQATLAERTGIPRRHISEMENGKRPIGKQNARKLAEVLNINPHRLLAV